MNARSSAATLIAALCAVAAAVAAQQPAGLTPLRPDADGRISFYIADGLLRAEYVTGDEQFVEWAFSEWQRALLDRVSFTRIASEQDALIRVYWLPWTSTGQAGQTARLYSYRQVTANIFLRPSPRTTGAALSKLLKSDPLLRDAFVYYVALHEIGHGLGLGHSPNAADVMAEASHTRPLAPIQALRERTRTRASLADTAVLSEGDVSRIRAAYQVK